MINELLISQTLQTSRIQLWDLIKCTFVTCMIACSLRDGRSVWIECGQEESSASLKTRDRQTLSIKLCCALCICPLPYSCHFHCVLYIKWVLPWLYLKKYDSQCTQTSQNTECPVGYFLFNYIFIKYLFICEILCHLKYNYVYFTHLFFNPFSNDLKCLKY